MADAISIDCSTGEVTKRALDASEVADRDEVAAAGEQVRIFEQNRELNADTIRNAATQALATNRTYVASTPTAAQTTAQVKALSRQNNGIIRLLLGLLDATD